MGFFDYVADLYSAVTVQTAEAEEPTKDTSGEQTSAKDTRSGGIGTAQHDRGAAVTGGASAKGGPASAGADESADEAEVNKKDAEGAKARMSSRGTQGGDEAGTNNAGAAGDDDAGEGAEEEGGDDAEEEEEEEEEDEEEPEDIKPKLEEDCLQSAQCAPLKHHYDECAERVTKQQEENGKADEDCVEEFFHMMHCATQCAAPKLFRQLR